MPPNHTLQECLSPRAPAEYGLPANVVHERELRLTARTPDTQEASMRFRYIGTEEMIYQGPPARILGFGDIVKAHTNPNPR